MDKFAGMIDENEPIAEEEVMENIRVMYDIFIQNSLDQTSHSIEWLDYNHMLVTILLTFLEMPIILTLSLITF